jgi:hypothetical protein
VLILQFCELNFMYTKQRVCHIYFGESVVRPNHDTLKGGRQSQVSIYLPFTLKEGQITYAGHMDCDKAYDPATRTLKLRFKKVLDNPKVDGIVLFKGKLTGRRCMTEKRTSTRSTSCGETGTSGTLPTKARSCSET